MEIVFTDKQMPSSDIDLRFLPAPVYVAIASRECSTLVHICWTRLSVLAFIHSIDVYRLLSVLTAFIHLKRQDRCLSIFIM